MHGGGVLDVLCCKLEAATGRTERELVALLVFFLRGVPALYGDSIWARGLPEQILINKFYTALIDDGYWLRLLEPKGLHLFDWLVVLLTAMLPVRMETWLRWVILAQDVAIIWASMAWPYI
ncbi:biphenyl-2,3-diol 1,2-dioxygenase 2 [Colletotrichum higginsianum]|nr:biphenyl-2,3-diol 1,2-dioxygenase 2 [Colletotrichum higginsianum]